MFRKILIISVIFILSVGSVIGSDIYKKYKISSNDNYLMKISFSDGQTILTMYGEKENETLVFDKHDVVIKNDTVFVKGKPVLCSRGFFNPDGLFSADEISKVKMNAEKRGKIEIFLTKKSKEMSSFVRFQSRNRFGLNQNIAVEQEEFLRGSAMSFWSNIKIEGEVNGHVIAVFGDIEIGDKAIIRGDVLAINGNVNHAKNSTIYGKIQATNVKDKHRFFKLWQLRRHKNNLLPGIKFYYNRIDGATPQFGFKYQNRELMHPEIEAFAGYGFASERWRYKIGLKQHLLKNHSLTIGGSFYKKLTSHDDWIISDNENTLFALLATEDYKDYLEAEGGRVAVEFDLPMDIDLEVGYQVEKYKWLEANRNLWSLFGGSKRFRPNYSSIDPTIRDSLKTIINGNELSSLCIKLSYNNKAKNNYPFKSFITARANLECLPSTWNEGLRYTLYRYWAEATRYQIINRKSGLIFRLDYGRIAHDMSMPISPFNIPIHKLFFLGGLGTLHGYDHKEFYGAEFWLGSIEYKIDFPAASWDTWLFYDIGQIGNPGNMSTTEVKNSVGVGLSFTDIIRINISRRLDRSDDTVTLYVRMKHRF